MTRKLSEKGIPMNKEEITSLFKPGKSIVEIALKMCMLNLKEYPFGEANYY